MDNKKLKKIMTDLAAGHITEKEAQTLMKPKKTRQNGLKQEFKRKNTHKRIKPNKTREVK